MTIPLDIQVSDDFKVESRFADPAIFVTFDNNISLIEDKLNTMPTESRIYGYYGVYTVLQVSKYLSYSPFKEVFSCQLNRIC